MKYSFAVLNTKIKKHAKSKTTIKYGSSSLVLLSLAACGGGNSGQNPAPGNNTPAPPSPSQMTNFTETATNVFNGTNGTFVFLDSTSDLTVTETNGGRIETGFGDDVINNGPGGSVVRGGAGADNMVGGSGIDVLDYSDAFAGGIRYSSTSAININLTNGTASGGDAEGDQFSGFEYVWGTNFNDIIIGDGNDNELQGRDGDDQLSGLGGNDEIHGSDGNDNIIGGEGNDIISGGLGTDVLDGGLGTDIIFFGHLHGLFFGQNVSYNAYADGSSAGVTVNLETGMAGRGGSDTDTISGFEIFYMSDNNDTFIGSAGADVAYGLEGNDNLSGRDGGDFLYGGEEDDILNGGADQDLLNGGAGDDIFLAYQADGSQQDTFAGGADNDTLAFISSSLVTPFAIDLSTVDITNIESINLDYIQAQDLVENLTLTVQDILDVTDGDNRLLIEGGSEDTVTSIGQGWVQGADQVIDGVTYNSYTSGVGSLLVDEDFTQTIS